MGLFLQKTNITRDLLEDYRDGRAFYPKEIWMKYSNSKKLGELVEPEATQRGIHCVNEMVTDALSCVPDCLEYMSFLKTPEIFRFCAITNIM
jgi:farnesyl-diphosphate farnesyltransferase